MGHNRSKNGYNMGPFTVTALYCAVLWCWEAANGRMSSPGIKSRRHCESRLWTILTDTPRLLSTGVSKT